MKSQKKKLVFFGCFAAIIVFAVVLTLAFTLSNNKSGITISLFNPIKNKTTLVKQNGSAVLKKVKHENISGYEFIGWFYDYDNEFSEKVDEEQIFSSSVGLVAGYSKILTKSSENFEITDDKFLTLTTSNGQKITNQELKKVATLARYLDLSNAEIENNEISDDTFSFSNISTIFLPKNLKTIGARAFLNCTNLKSVEFGDELISINEMAFDNCKKLENLVLPESLKNLGNNVFQNCTLSLKIGSNLENFNAKSFQYAKINTLEISQQNSNFLVVDGCIYTRDLKRLVYCFNNNDIELNVSTIDDYAFFESENKKILLKGIEKIGNYAFANMENLSNVKIENSNVFDIGEFAFYNCKNLKNIEIGYGLKEIKNSAFKDCVSLDKINFISSTDENVQNLEIVGENAFDGCKELKTISLPDSVTELKNGAFANCEKLKSVFLSSKLSEIKAETFKNCYDLENILAAENILSVDNYAFLNCIQLEDISFFENVISIGTGAFKDCESLQNAELSKIKVVSQEAFMNCENLITAKFEQAENILQNAFYGCKKMRTFTFYENISQIDFSAFENAGLESVSSFSEEFYSENGILFNKEKTAILLYPLLKNDRIFTIKANILQISSKYFFENQNIEKFVVEEENNVFASDNNGVLLSYDRTKIIKYPNASVSTYYVKDDIKVIGKNAFAFNTKLKNLIIPIGVEKIESSCFKNTELESLEMPFVGETRESNKFIGYGFGASEYIANESTLPSSLTKVVITDDSCIAPYSFFGAKQLSQIEITADDYVINEYAFFSTENLKTLILNGAVPEIKQYSLANMKQSNLQITFHFNSDLMLEENSISALPNSTKVYVKGQIKYEQIMQLKSKFQQIYAPSYYWPWEFLRY